MIPNPFLGVFFHWLGGLASGSFYVPYKEVRKWAWETYWLVGGFFSWIIAPWVGATIMIPHLGQVLRETPPDVLFWAYFWGAMWGIGGLTFGLTMRYLGMSLGMAVALGYCAAFGTLMPPIFSGKIGGMFYKDSGLIILLGVAVCLGGIAVAGIAGMSKEKEMPEEEKKAAIKEFNFPKGILVATFSGILSASMAYGLLAANPMADLAIHLGTPRIWTGLPKLVVVLLGGFTTNFIWCVILNVRNKTGYQYFNSEIRGPVPTRDQETIIETASDAPGEEMARRATQLDFGAGEPNRAPMIRNYCFSALAGVTWYMQFFFYTMGQTQMGKYDFSSWTLHMASIIIFSSLWGIGLKEWKGVSTRTWRMLLTGLAVLIGSTVIIGYGNYVASGIKATASTISSPEYSPDMAVDGNPDTRWATPSGTKQAWLELHYLEPKTVNSVQIKEVFDHVRKFELQYQSGGEWKTLLAGTTIGGSFEKKFDAMTAQEFRLNILTATDGPAIAEIALQGT